MDYARRTNDAYQSRITEELPLDYSFFLWLPKGRQTGEKASRAGRQDVQVYGGRRCVAPWTTKADWSFLGISNKAREGIRGEGEANMKPLSSHW